MVKFRVVKGGQSLLLFWVLFLNINARAQTDQAIYTDALQNGWQNWSWQSTINLNNANPVHGGSTSISVTLTSAWSAFYLHRSAFNSSGYSNLTFWIHGGGSGGQQLQVQAILSTTNPQPAVTLAALTANSWQLITLSLTSLQAANRSDLDGFWIQDRIGAAQPTFYVDDVTLTVPTPATNSNVVPIVINALANQRAINPLIYGVAFATSNQLADLNSPLNRSGGNTETRYNWLINAKNRGADWYFESLAESSSSPAGSADEFVADSKGGGADTMMTIPMIGWVPKLGPSRQRLSSFSIAKYGMQDDHDWQWFADAGNGVVTNSNTLITTNNPNDANFLTNSVFQQGFVRHLTNAWGKATNGGVKYYVMDNEHSIWHSTHRDVHPIGAKMQEIRDKFFDYAGMLKAIDPNVLIAAPEEWGWTGYFYSGFDQQWASANGNWNPALMPDRGTNGGLDYMPWFLDQAYRRATNTNQRLLDIFTLHIYPQGGEYPGDTSTSTQLRRNRSTRALWDTNYVDETWIGQTVKLIPRMKGWVAAYYPSTKIGITEYNWGSEDHINGATAQADIFGIFGREGLDLATRWTTPAANTPTYKAMKMYRNYDNNKSGFGETSVLASVPNPDQVSAFAAVRASDGALTAMVINKQLSSSATAVLTVTNFPANGIVQRWQLTAANTINQLTNVTFSGTVLSNTVPSQSVTLFVFQAANPPHLRLGGMSGPSSFNFWLDGQAGQRYVIQGATNLVNWVPVQTNTLASNSLQITVSTTGRSYRFFRAQWVP